MTDARLNDLNACELCEDTSAPCTQVPHYRVRICPACQERNRPGWRREHEALLFAGLGRSGLLIPDRTEQGLLPFHYQPPSDYAI